MTITDKLKDLIEKESVDEVIVFLKELSVAERKSFAPDLKELNAYYGELVDLSTMNKPDGQLKVGRSYGARARGKQSLVLSIASFICLDKKAYERGFHPGVMLSQEILDQILPWYTPSWFKQLLEDINTGSSYRLNYDLIMHLQAAGYFVPSPELILIHLPSLIYRNNRIGQETHNMSEELLLKYPDTLNKHFWYIFDHPSDIHNLSRYHKETKNWKDFILQFTAEGRLDRMRILRESLLTANRNFNKILVSWFMDLFTSLKPTAEELQALQPLLMMLLDSKHTAAVSLALSFLKQLKGLDHNALITHLPQVILSGTKSILTSVLQLSETICRQHEAVRQQVGIQLCQIFLNKEEVIQQKTAKVITTYCFPASEALQDQLQQYADAMLTGVRQLLIADPVTIVLADEEQRETLPLIGEHNLIPTVNTVEELIYFASQVFENNEPYHAELLPAILINLEHLITDDILIQLKPALKRAEKLWVRPSGNMGLLSHLLTRFMLNYFKVADDTASRYVTQDLTLPHDLLWQHALAKLEAKDPLPLLSTPTHTPGWIDPVTLVQRLAQYKNKTPHDLDLQIAICRCALEDTTEALALAKQLLTGEHRDLLLFLLDNSAVSSKDGNAWIQAANRKGIDLTKGKIPAVYINGNFSWSTEQEDHYGYGAYNREAGGYDRVQTVRTSIRIKFPAVTSLNESKPLLQEYQISRSRIFALQQPDVPGILSLTPANPSLVLANTIQHLMPLSGLYEVRETTVITATIAWLKEQAVPHTATAQLFIATCMLHTDNTIRMLAAECWITGVTYKRLDSDEIGRVIGIHERVEWAPLKRFTDLVTGHMMQISKLHNEALEVLLSACIELLPDTPIKNLKKLLEVYSEVLVVNGHTTNPLVKERLAAWEALPGLKKLVSKVNV